MKKTLFTSLATGLFLIGMAAAGAANASPYQGYLYDTVAANSNATSQSVLQTLESTDGGSQTLDAIFTVQDINFDSSRVSGANTYTQFFQGGATNINGLTPLSAFGSANISTSSTTAALVKIVGQAYFDNSFSITHDDGVMILVGGKLFDASYPTSPITSSFTLASQSLSAGLYNFEIFYEAWNGNPEVLTTRGINAVPEPATMLLFGAGIAGLAGVARRKRS